MKKQVEGRALLQDFFFENEGEEARCERNTDSDEGEEETEELTRAQELLSPSPHSEL